MKKNAALLFLMVIICLIFSCKKDEEEKSLPIKDVTKNNFYGTWISTNEPNKTVVMVLVEYDMWETAGSDLCKLYTITPTDTTLDFDGNFSVTVSNNKGYFITNNSFHIYTNEIFEYSDNKIVVSSNLPGGKREFTRTTSKLTPRKNIDFSAFKFYGNNASGPCIWNGLTPEQLNFNSQWTQIICVAEKGGKTIYAGIEASSTSQCRAYYMENGVATQLEEALQTTANLYYYLKGMVVVNNDVYIVAQVNETTSYSAWVYYGYWKNGIWHMLTGPKKNVNGTIVTSDLFISGCCTEGSHLYISGNYTYGAITQPFYYKDTTLIDLDAPAGANCAGTSGIFYTANSLYVCGSLGYPNNQACYWKDGAYKALDYSGECKVANVINGVLCTIGTEANSGQTEILPVFTVGEKTIHATYNVTSMTFTSIQANNDYYFIPAYSLNINDYGVWIISKDLKNSDFLKLNVGEGSVIRILKAPN